MTEDTDPYTDSLKEERLRETDDHYRKLDDIYKKLDEIEASIPRFPIVVHVASWLFIVVIISWIFRK